LIVDYNSENRKFFKNQYSIEAHPEQNLYYAKINDYYIDKSAYGGIYFTRSFRPIFLKNQTEEGAKQIIKAYKAQLDSFKIKIVE